MPPKSNKKRDTKKKELTADDMRRLGMTEDDIARIIGERGKSSEDKKAEQDREEQQRKESDLRRRQQREIAEAADAIVRAEAAPRSALLTEEDFAWVALAAPLTVEKTRVLRQHHDEEAKRRGAEARRKRAADLAEWQASLASMTEEERATLIAAQEALEASKQEELIRAEHDRSAREQRREARRLARADRARNSGLTAEEAYLKSLISSDDDGDDNGDGGGGAAGDAKKRGKNAFQAKLDEMDFAMRERYVT